MAVADLQPTQLIMALPIHLSACQEIAAPLGDGVDPQLPTVTALVVLILQIHDEGNHKLDQYSMIFPL